MNNTLYARTEEYVGLLERAYEECDAEDGQIGIEMQKLLDESSAAWAVKAEGVCRAQKELAGLALVAKSESARLAARSKAFEARAEWLKGYLLAQMTKLGMEKLKTELFSVSVCDSPEALKIVSRDLIPLNHFYTKTETVLDTEGLKAALKAGEPVPGAELVRGQHVRIR